MTLFKRPAAHYGKSPEPETPYQKAAQVWDERIGSARVQARNWRFMAFGSLILSAGFAAALVWQSARGTVVPWVVQVGVSARQRPGDPDHPKRRRPPLSLRHHRRPGAHLHRRGGFQRNH